MKLTLLLLFVACLAAEPYPVVSLSLEEALAKAEKLRPELAELRALAEAGEAKARASGRFPNPEAIAGVESAPLRGRTTGEAEYLAGVAQSIPLGNRLGSARAAGALEAQMQSSAMEVRRRELHRNVHAAFATALYQQEAAQLQREAAEALRRTVEIARARVEAGDAAPDEVARAEMEQARAQLEANRAESLRAQAFTALAAAVGDPALQIQAAKGELRQTFAIPSIEALNAALQEHPLLALASAETRLQEARFDLAKAERIPDLKVEVLYRRIESERRNAADLAVSIPIPLFDRGAARVRAARSELAAAEARRQASAMDLQARARQARTRLNAALAELNLAENEVLPRAERVAQAAETRLELGDVALGEVLLVRREWGAARLAWLEALSEAMAAWVELRSLLPEAIADSAR